jgi:hypothetical protein
MKRLQLFLLIFTLFSVKILAQDFDKNIDDLQKGMNITIGANYGILRGNIAPFMDKTWGGDVSIGGMKNNFIYGIHMQFLASKAKQYFTAPPNYTNYDNPSLLLMGGYIGKIFGKKYDSHTKICVGVSYIELYHKKLVDKVEPFNGVSPTFEIARNFKIGKTTYSSHEYTSQFTAPAYKPSINKKFIELFFTYKYLALNSSEAKGNLFVVGLRYSIGRFYLDSEK